MPPEREQNTRSGCAPVADRPLTTDQVRPHGNGATKPLVYIAGPYTHPDPVTNTREACLVADRVAEMGAAVIVPHLSLLWHAISPQPIETWYERDLDVLRHCHALVRLAGASIGADAEVAEAHRLSIPVYSWLVGNGQLAAFIGGWRP